MPCLKRLRASILYLTPWMNTCRIPFYIAAPTTTIDPSLADGSSIPIEERNPAEVTHHQGQQVAAPGIDVSRFRSVHVSEMQY